MGVQAVDYRVSTLVVLCKDCSQDVGLYPARHKCLPVERPAMPTLPSKYQQHPPSLELNARTISSGSTCSNTSSSPSASFSSVDQPTSKWSSRLNKSPVTEDDKDSVYFNNFANNLPEDQPSGKKLWGKIKQNDKWKQISEKNDKPKQSGKLWGKLMQATQNMADKIPSRDDRGADSDEDDWEGETHVSRILREYYERKHMRLPEWLFDDDTPMTTTKKQSYRRDPQQFDSMESPNAPVRTPSRRRLWEESPDDSKFMSSRERERQALRQAQPPPPPVPSSTGNDRSSMDERYNYKNEDHYNNRDYGRDDRHSQQDRYSQERRSRDNQYDGRGNQRQREEDHHNDRYSNNSRREDYREPPRSERQPPSRRYDDLPSNMYYNQRPQSPPQRYQEKPVDHYYSQRPQSPPRQQPLKSMSKPRYYDDDVPSSVASAPRSERSARGFQRESPRSSNRNEYRGNDLDDYYYERR